MFFEVKMWTENCSDLMFLKYLMAAEAFDSHALLFMSITQLNFGLTMIILWIVIGSLRDLTALWPLPYYVRAYYE